MAWHKSRPVCHITAPEISSRNPANPAADGFPKPCLPITNPWTWIYAPMIPIYSAFQQPFVSMAGCQSLKNEWVSAWIKIWKIEFCLFSLGGWICRLDELFVESFKQSLIICLSRGDAQLLIVISVQYFIIKPPKPSEIVDLYLAHTEFAQHSIDPSSPVRAFLHSIHLVDAVHWCVKRQAHHLVV